MAKTKQAIINQALTEIGIRPSSYTLPDAQLAEILERLDWLLYSWDQEGISLSYNGGGDISSDSGLPDWAARPAALGLAIEIAPGYGKQVLPATNSNFRSAFNTMVHRSARACEMQFDDRMPIGAGNKPWRWTNQEFMRRPDTGPVVVSGDEKVILNNGECQ